VLKSIKKLGPGFVFAGAAIGVSHLVQSTRAGADFGFGLIWALLLINVVKYPFFEFGPRYAAATGESLLHGYKKLGKGVLIAYFILTFATMFTIQTAVTIVTAGIAASLYGSGSIVWWTIVITVLCSCILLLGRYKVLDNLMKIIVMGLTLSTIFAVVIAFPTTASEVTLTQVLPTDVLSIAFLIAFMGWMPAPLDISIWHSVWTVEKVKLDPSISAKNSRFDFKIGYITTTVLALGFLALGALVMYESGATFSSKGGEFANQLIAMYTNSLGDGFKIIIGIAALTTMFSTTLTTLDGSPRVMKICTQLLAPNHWLRRYYFWVLLLAVGTLIIFLFFSSEMGVLIHIATILSFLTAPFYAILNYWLLTSKHTPSKARPSLPMRMLSIFGVLVLLSFSIWYLYLLT
jgi:Mn2+/Fe2+ NRAMP family transporter